MPLSGTVMSRDYVVATVRNGLIVSCDERRLPLYLLKTKDIVGWLESRAIDSHRTNSRLLKRALRIASSDDLAAVLHVHAATITDTYWFQEEGSTLTYDEVRFSENLFDKLALRGDPDSFNQPCSRTPELTNIGSFEKCWSRRDGRWWMIKNGNEQERFSELFIYALGKRLGLEMATYEPDGDYVRSEDFTRGATVNFEPAVGIVGDNEDYSFNFEAMSALCPLAAEQYVAMLYLDTLCFNMDRHTLNYGILRDVETGQILSLAPLFDHNIALIARGYPRIDRNKDKLVELFAEFLNNTPKARDIFEKLPLPKIDEDLVRECIEAVPVKVDADFVCRFILNGEQQLQNALEQQGFSMEMQ